VYGGGTWEVIEAFGSIPVEMLRACFFVARLQVDDVDALANDAAWADCEGFRRSGVVGREAALAIDTGCRRVARRAGEDHERVENVRWPRRRADRAPPSTLPGWW
jgi:hypothetical protein